VGIKFRAAVGKKKLIYHYEHYTVCMI